MKKLFLLIGLIFFLTPTFASAETIKYGCQCDKHTHKYKKSLSQFFFSDGVLADEEKKCPSIGSLFFVDNENMVVYGDFWHNVRDKYWESGEYFYFKYNITLNTNEKLSASKFRNDIYHRDGSYKIDIIKNDNKYKIVVLWDRKPKKNGSWVERTYNCKVLSTTQPPDPFEAKQQLCGKLGFELGSQENGNCVLKIFEIESSLKQKEKSAGGQLTDTDKLIRQQSLNQSLLLMQQGLNLMSPPQPKLNCRTTLMGWTCY